MELSVNDIAGVIQAEVTGDAAFIIKGVSSFSDASMHDITFASESVFLADLTLTLAKTVIVPDDFTPGDKDISDKIILRTQNPKISFFEIVHLFHPLKENQPVIEPGAYIGKNVLIGTKPVIQSNAYIGNNVNIGDNVLIMPGVYIGDGSTIGDHCLIKPNVTIMERSKIGSNVIIHSGSVIGSDGFGFAQDEDRHTKLIHTGYVSIGDDTEIGACNTIDRGTLGMTKIGNGVKTDNQVHIAHNVTIGDNTLIVAQVGIAGSAYIGKNVIIAGKTGITGHIKIGDNTIVGPYSGVTSDVPENQVVSGVPHMPHKNWLKVSRILSRLPDLRKKLLSFEKRLKNIEKNNKSLE